MIKEYGSGPAWQRAMTFVWVNKLLSEYSDKKQIFFEGQVNLDFIIEAFAEHNYANYQIILVHCDTDKRHKRLAELRNQPDLINAEMDNWSKFLFNQAIKKNAIILDTGNQTITELIEWCKRHLN
jgi:dephospho-CoA kinase